MDTKGKIFIVGVGRSGTSLLQAMMASHRDIVFLPETGFLRRYVACRRLWKMPAGDLRSLLLSDRRLKRIKWFDATIEQIKSTEKFSIIDVYDTLLRACPECRWVGDKDPRNVELIDALAFLWPEARFIHLLRDPRDVLCSKKKAAWSSGRNLLNYLVAGEAQIRMAERAGDCVDGDHLLLLKYEDLICDAERQLKRICGWLEIEFDRKMLTFGEAANQLVAEEEMAWKKETLGPLNTRNSGRWRNALTRFEIAAIESACSSAMELGEYPKAHPKLSKLQQIWLSLTVRLSGFIACVYVWRRSRENALLNRQNLEWRNGAS